MNPTEGLTAKQKRRALEDALGSETFARADQLKKFLRYIVEMEIAGKGDQISEHLVGIEALGRPEDFSPTEDSAVRTRAKALREKLRDLYERELPDAPVRIELQRGSYAPRFIHISAPHPAETPQHAAIGTAPIVVSGPAVRGLPTWVVAAAILTGFALGAGALLLLRQPPAILIFRRDTSYQPALRAYLNPGYTQGGFNFRRSSLHDLSVHLIIAHADC